MSTLTQILFAAVLNYLGISGEVKGQAFTHNIPTDTELRIPGIEHFQSSKFKVMESCQGVYESEKVITYIKINR